MRRVTIAVIGNAKTTRANVEALIGDVVDSVDEAAIATVYDQAQSDGQVWAEQYAQDKELPVFQYAHNAYEELIAENKVEDIKFFMLWDDEDPACQLAASIAQEHTILAYDLTDGLIMIPLNSEPILRPVQTEIPVAEEVSEEVPVVEVILVPEESEDLYEDEEDENELEYDLGELMTLAIEQAGKIFARSFAEEFIKLLKK
jgi:hypothetical protein